MCVFACALCLYPASPGWGLQCVCMCLVSAFRCAPPFVAGVFGCLFLCVRAAPIQPIMLGGLGARVLVRVLAFTPQILAWVLGRVCFCARSAFAPPVLALVCGVGLYAWLRVFAAPRHS